MTLTLKHNPNPNPKVTPFFIQHLRDDPPTSYLLLYVLQSIIKMHVTILCYE